MADREKVIRGLKTCRTRVHCKECPYAYDKRADDSYCEAVLHNDVLELLKEQPEIVRCKDCKYYDHFNGCMSWHDVNSNNDNWYCADGERKEGR